MCIGSYTESEGFIIVGRSLRMEAMFISIDPAIAFIISEAIIISGIAGKRIKIKCDRIKQVKSAYFRRLLLVKGDIASRQSAQLFHW